MSRDFWLGVAVLPALAAACLLLWLAARYVNRAGVWLVNRLRLHCTPERASVRSGAGAAVACARRTVWVPLPFDTVLVFAVGHDFEQVEPIRKAIYNVLVPPATVRLRTPRVIVPRVDIDAEEEE